MSDLLIFAGNNYYPCGGVDDLVHRLDGTVDDAVAWLRKNTVKARSDETAFDYRQFEWFQIVDAETMKPVLEGKTYVRGEQGEVCPPDEDKQGRVVTAVSSCGEPWCPPIEALVDE